MEKSLEESGLTAAPGLNTLPHSLLSVVLFVLMIAGFVVSALAGAWPPAAIFAVALLAMAVYSAVISINAKRLSAAVQRQAIDWEDVVPDLQRESLKIEVTELSRVLEVGSDQINDLQSAYIVAEDLALRQIQHEEGVPLMRHVSVGKASFDAVFFKERLLVCCEVSFVVSPELRQEKIDAMLRKISLVKTKVAGLAKDVDVRLMMIVITQLVPEDVARLRSALNTGKFKGTPVDIDIRLLDFESLQKIYVTE